MVLCFCALASMERMLITDHCVASDNHGHSLSDFFPPFCAHTDVCFYHSARLRATPRMTAVTEAEHSARRRTFGGHYTQARVSRFQPDVNGSVTKLVEVRVL